MFEQKKQPLILGCVTEVFELKKQLIILDCVREVFELKKQPLILDCVTEVFELKKQPLILDCVREVNLYLASGKYIKYLPSNNLYCSTLPTTNDYYCGI